MRKNEKIVRFVLKSCTFRFRDYNNPMKEGNGLYVFPAGSGVMGRAPYMEASVGIENIFKFMRLDYVWRLNYCDNPGIQKRGVRCTMSVSF